MELVEGLCNPGSLQVVIIPGDPISKARARWGGSKRPYTPKKTVDGEKVIAWSLKGIPKFNGNVVVACIFQRASYQRVDTDNMLKAVLDGGTKAGVWNDDSQVTALIGIAEYDRDDPRTVVCFAEHKSTLTRGENAMSTCESCGKKFIASGNKRRHTARWCSIECRMRLRETMVCVQCGKEFQRIVGRSQTVCSEECRRQRLADKNRANSGKSAYCKRGHPFDEENTHVLPNGHRRCRKCQAENAQKYRERKSLK